MNRNCKIPCSDSEVEKEGASSSKDSTTIHSKDGKLIGFLILSATEHLYSDCYSEKKTSTDEQLT